MESSIITTVLLPVALGIIMLGMGLSLVPDDFRRVILYPKAVAIGLMNQLILLPLLGLGLCFAFGMRPEFAVGLMILAACPGGVTSNLISHLSKGDTALSITLTAISSLVTIITVPLIINFSLETFMDAGKEVQMPVLKTIGTILLITLLPVAIGMLVRGRNRAFADRMEKPVKIASAVILVVVIAGAIVKERAILADAFRDVGLSTLALNAGSMLIGYLTARLFRLNMPQSVSVSIESGIQNGTLAIFIAVSLLKNPAMSIPPAVYSLVMFGTGGFMMFVFGRRKAAAAA